MTTPATPPPGPAPHGEAVRDEETIDRLFPDAGPPPDNVVVVDPDAPPAPNVAHPH